MVGHDFGLEIRTNVWMTAVDLPAPFRLQFSLVINPPCAQLVLELGIKLLSGI